MNLALSGNGIFLILLINSYEFFILNFGLKLQCVVIKLISFLDIFDEGAVK